MSLIKISIYIGNLLIFINAILYIWSLFKTIKAPKIFVLYLSLCGFNQLLSLVLLELGENNLFLSHFYFIIQFVLLSIFFKNLFESKSQQKIVDYVLILVLAIIGIQYVYDKDLFFRFNLFEIVLTSIPLIMYAIVHFYNMLGKEKEYFYINSGILIYLTGSTLLFVAGNYIVASNSVLNKSIWIINSVLFVVYQILIFIEWKKSFYQKEIQ